MLCIKCNKIIEEKITVKNDNGNHFHLECIKELQGTSKKNNDKNSFLKFLGFYKEKIC